MGNLKNTLGKQVGGDKNYNTQSILRIASLNTHIFNYFDKPNTQSVYQSIKADIKSQKSDILCLQEFLSYKTHTAEKVQKDLGYPYSYFKKLKDGRKAGVFGMLILSKFPIIDTGYVSFNPYSGNICAWVTIDIEGESMHVFSVHLQSIGLDKKDFINIKSPEWEQSKSTFKRISNASIQREKQVKLLQKELSAKQGPIILVGDFNATPVSYTYLQLIRNMEDAFVLNSFGIEQTYKGKVPGMRIDYILCNGKIKPVSYKSMYVESDHKMLISDLALP